MKTRIYIVLSFFVFLGLSRLNGQSLDSVSLMNVDSSMISFSDYHSEKAVVLIFSGNHCVYAKKYEERLIRLAKEYGEKSVRIFFINSNSPTLSSDDRFELMVARAKEKQYPFPYLQDKDGSLAKKLGASKNPEAFVFVWKEEWKLLYSGKIDDNPLMEENVNEHFLKAQIDKVLDGNLEPAGDNPATGCNIKFKD